MSFKKHVLFFSPLLPGSTGGGKSQSGGAAGLDLLGESSPWWPFERSAPLGPYVRTAAFVVSPPFRKYFIIAFSFWHCLYVYPLIEKLRQERGISQIFQLFFACMYPCIKNISLFYRENIGFVVTQIAVFLKMCHDFSLLVSQKGSLQYSRESL